MALLVGQQSAGTTGDFSNSGSTDTFPFVASASGTVGLMWFQTKVANPSLTAVRLGIYANNAGVPGTRLGFGTASPTPTGTGLFSVDLSGSAISIVSGTTYFLAVFGTGEQFDIQGTVTAGANEWNGQDFPTTLSGASSMNVFPVIWAESAGGPATNEFFVPWNELGPLDAFGPDPFNPYDSGIVTLAGPPQTVDLSGRGLASAQQFGTVWAWTPPIPNPDPNVFHELLGISPDFGPDPFTPYDSGNYLNISVAGIPSAQAFGIPTMLPGGVTVVLTGLNSAQAFGTPQLNIAFPVTGLGSAQAFGSPTVTNTGGGAQTVDMTGLGLASAQAFGTVTIVAGGVTAVLSGLGSAQAFGTTQENIAFPVSGLNSAQAFGAVTITTGGVTVPVNGLISAGQFGTPIVTTPGGGPTYGPEILGGRSRRRRRR